MCAWHSTPPGSTTLPPTSTSSRASAREAGARTAATRPSRMPTSSTASCSGVTTRPPRSTVSNGSIHPPSAGRYRGGGPEPRQHQRGPAGYAPLVFGQVSVYRPVEPASPGADSAPYLALDLSWRAGEHEPVQQVVGHAEPLGQVHVLLLLALGHRAVHGQVICLAELAHGRLHVLRQELAFHAAADKVQREGRGCPPALLHGDPGPFVHEPETSEPGLDLLDGPAGRHGARRELLQRPADGLR